MSTLLTEINNLKNELITLKAQIAKIQSGMQTEDEHTPYTKSGGAKDPSMSYPVSINSGFGGTYGNAIIWNDIDIELPPFGRKPASEPKFGLNWHGHTRYTGGAFDLYTTELVEYDVNWEENDRFSKYHPGLWDSVPNIMKDEEGSEQISGLNFSFIKEEIQPNIVWHTEDKIFRFYAVYAEEEEQ